MQHWPGILSMKSILLVGVLMALSFIGLLGMFVFWLNIQFLVSNLYILWLGIILFWLWKEKGSVFEKSLLWDKAF